jgi:hypothetical protein
MMAQLVLVFCLMTQPGSCQEERPLLSPIPLASCMVEAQLYAQGWLAEHPKWALSAWRCEGGGTGRPT